MGPKIDRTSGALRFERLLTDAGGALHDRPLLRRRSWLLAPTLGPIVEGWFLAIPRRNVLNFQEWSRFGEGDAMTIVREVNCHLSLKPTNVIWFEHGPARTHTAVGCGLDHAHLHILVMPKFSFDNFVEVVRDLSSLDWRETSSDDAYEDLVLGTSYLIAGCGNRSISACEVEGEGSQFFRRVVARLAGDPDSWNYRDFEHPDEVRSSVSLFKKLESSANRVC